MSQVVILKKSGAAIRLNVVETAENVYQELSEGREDPYSGRFIRNGDFIILSLTTGEKLVINKRYICYVQD